MEPLNKNTSSRMSSINPIDMVVSIDDPDLAASSGSVNWASPSGGGHPRYCCVYPWIGAPNACQPRIPKRKKISKFPPTSVRLGQLHHVPKMSHKSMSTQNAVPSDMVISFGQCFNSRCRSLVPRLAPTEPGVGFVEFILDLLEQARLVAELLAERIDLAVDVA